MDLASLSDKPKPLEYLFAYFEESLFRYNRDTVRDYLFNYASRVLDLEGIKSEDSDANDFREFVMRNELRDVVNETLRASINMKHPENCELLLDADRTWQNYHADPRNAYLYEIFKKSGFSRKEPVSRKHL